MIYSKEADNKQLILLVHSIKEHMNEWQIVTININSQSGLSIDDVSQKLLKQYKQYEGVIYPASSDRLVMLVRLGWIEDFTVIKSQIEDRLPEHACRVLVKKMNMVGLRQIQIDLIKKGDGLSLTENLFNIRLERKNNVIMVVDDDDFVRVSMKKLLGASAEVIEIDNAKALLKDYLKYNPDIIFLDIHMPDVNGLDLIKNIMEVDPDAFILTLSADSSTENVLIAMERGAVGFLSKPPSKKKVQEYLAQCITFK